MKKANKKKRIIVAAGGTGGHLFPALATSRVLLSQNYDVIFFTDKRALSYLKKSGYTGTTYRILGKAFAGGSAIKKLISIFMLGLGCLQALFLYLRFRPNITIGFGGFAAVPAYFACNILKKKYVIHEQNAILGKTNKMFEKNAQAIVSGLPLKDNQDAQWYGTPLRSEFTLADAPKKLRINNGLNILIMGGSQGASSLAKLIPNALSLLSADKIANINIIQQARQEDIATLKLTYKNLGVNATVESFITDVATKMRQSDLYIGRAGASSICEAWSQYLPMVLIPYPYASLMHQHANAQAVVEHQGGILIDEKLPNAEEKLSKFLQNLLDNPNELDALSANLANAFIDNENLAMPTHSFVNKVISLI